MGYELYITRADSWLETESNPISQPEWDAIVVDDPELEVSTDDFYERKKNGRIERFHSVLWKAHPDQPPFMLIDGGIQIKNPDTPTIAKMVTIARKLNARVLGESDEEYGPDGNPIA